MDEIFPLYINNIIIIWTNKLTTYLSSNTEKWIEKTNNPGSSYFSSVMVIPRLTSLQVRWNSLSFRHDRLKIVLENSFHHREAICDGRLAAETLDVETAVQTCAFMSVSLYIKPVKHYKHWTLCETGLLTHETAMHWFMANARPLICFFVFRVMYKCENVNWKFWHRHTSWSEQHLKQEGLIWTDLHN